MGPHVHTGVDPGEEEPCPPVVEDLGSFPLVVLLAAEGPKEALARIVALEAFLRRADQGEVGCSVGHIPGLAAWAAGKALVALACLLVEVLRREVLASFHLKEALEGHPAFPGEVEDLDS